MPLDVPKTRRRLATFEFEQLFIEELGWNHHNLQMEVSIDGHTFKLSAAAQKCGMPAFVCHNGDTSPVPDSVTRRRIERQVARSAHEHLIIFVDGKRTTQIWQWVRREPGRHAAWREHMYRVGQSGDSLIQKLQVLAVSLKEEEELTLPDVTGRVRRAFDIDRVTKRFYDGFKAEHSRFLGFLKGIPDQEMQRWYVCVMLNRLMFIYFVQKKGFLDGDPDYLRNKFVAFRKEYGKGRFYRDFLCPLFFEGFAKWEDERSRKARDILGRVPYLNGGIFQKHQIEKVHERTIDIPDEPFESLFAFFDTYQWHLDDRPTANDAEICPDVLGYVFEKYINQKQMGAYYTKEDITEYISKSTIIPFLFGTVRRDCQAAFAGDDSVWRLLQEDPDRYIYEAVRRGVEHPLPPEIREGVDPTKPNLFERRKHWNKRAPSQYSLPTETWREIVARRRRYKEMRGKLAAGEVSSIDDVITYNLNLCQFAQDAIQTRERPDLLLAFWNAIEKVTVLDPTCGSGAFLFAALKILAELYEASLERMEFFLDKWDDHEKKSNADYCTAFNEILNRVDDHPNRNYFILKSILVNNLYGVDILEEAVEICRLRLFLALASQLELDQTKPNLGVKPLPDLDFNIRSGNTLVGFASLDQVRNTLAGKLPFPEIKVQIALIERQAEAADRAFSEFHQMQIERKISIREPIIKAKENLRTIHDNLRDELDQFLVGEYTADTTDRAFTTWRQSHQPFHWFAEFYGIFKSGGFDVIIGNPPYLEVRQVTYEPKNYASLETGAIHAMCIERSTRLLHKKGCMSMIVPLSLPSTQRMHVVQRLLEAERNTWYANYAWRPGKLFDAVNRALTIFVVTPCSDGSTFSTNYQKWTTDNRDGLLGRLYYVAVARRRPGFWIPKLGTALEQRILEKCLSVKTVVRDFSGSSEHRIYYRTTGGLYWKVFTDFAPAFRLNGKADRSSRETYFTLAKHEHIKPLIAALSSDVFWWWYTISSNLRDLNPYDIQNFPVPQSVLTDPELQTLGDRYLRDLDRNSTMLVREQKQTGRTETQSFKIQKSKPIIDTIDQALARHYGFTEEELDFLTNYDVKYRMGQGTCEEGEG